MAVVNGKTKLAGEFDRKGEAAGHRAENVRQGRKEQSSLLAITCFCARSRASMEERRQRSRLLAARDEFMQKLGQERKARLAGAFVSVSLCVRKPSQGPYPTRP